jgi:hypothetical protein
MMSTMNRSRSRASVMRRANVEFKSASFRAVDAVEMLAGVRRLVSICRRGHRRHHRPGVTPRVSGCGQEAAPLLVGMQLRGEVGAEPAPIIGQPSRAFDDDARHGTEDWRQVPLNLIELSP